MISTNLEAVWAAIKDICEKCGRDPDETTLVGVTKFADSEADNEAVKAGLRAVGENKVQEALNKFPSITEPHGPVARHMIGHLQTNKVKQALEIFDLIQSVDSLKLLETIDKGAAHRGKYADVLIQVNTAGEEQKFGLAPDNVDAFLEHAAGLQHVNVLGLMAIAPLTDDTSAIRKCFSDLRGIYEAVGRNYTGSERIQMKHLSMGMTADYTIAIEEGSNMVRIGRAIFN